jgi:hypothetical protein
VWRRAVAYFGAKNATNRNKLGNIIGLNVRVFLIEPYKINQTNKYTLFREIFDVSYPTGASLVIWGRITNSWKVIFFIYDLIFITCYGRGVAN